MINIGLPEFMLLAIIAIIFIGPERLPLVARWLGKQTARVRRAWRDIQTDMSEDDDFRAIKEAGQDLHREIKSARRGFESAEEKVKSGAADASRTLMGGDGDGTSLSVSDPFDDELEILRQSRMDDEDSEKDDSSSETSDVKTEVDG